MAKRRAITKGAKPRKRDFLAAGATDQTDSGIPDGADEGAREAWKGWKESQTHLEKWREAAAEAYDFYAGVQWTEDDVQKLTSELRPVITFNRTKPVADAVLGYEINSRQSVTYQPRNPEDTGPAQVDTAAASFFREDCDAESEETNQFRDTLICGLGWTEHRIDYDENPEGMLVVERIDPFEMGYDPSAQRPNLRDSRKRYRGRWMDKDRAKELWPEQDFDSADTMHNSREDADANSPIRVPENAYYRDGNVGAQYERRRGKVFILEMQYFVRVAFYTTLNPFKGITEDLSSEEHTKLQRLFKEKGMEPLRSLKRTKKEYRRRFVFGPTTLEDEPNPCPTMFTYQCVTGFLDRNRNYYFGLVQAMKDPQRWANKWLSQQLHLINSNAKGRTFWEDGAFDNGADIEKKLAQPGAFIKVAQGKLDKVRTEPPLQLPSNSFQLMEYAITSIRDSVGVNVELLGMADRNQPGVLEQQRKQSAMAILAPLFDSKRFYIKNAGRLTLHFIQAYLSDERLIRIVGDGGAKYVPLAKRPDVVEYDIIVDEAPSSPNQKEAVFGVLMQTLPAIMKTGVPVPPELLDYIPGLPADLVLKWKGLIQEQKANSANQVPPEVQKANAELQLQQQKAAQEAALAEQKMNASIAEQRARAEADIAIKHMQAEADRQIERQKAEQEMAIMREKADLALALKMIQPTAAVVQPSGVI